MSKPSWENLSIHKRFLADKARNEAYFASLKELATKFESAVDIGSGTGILSFLAAKAGFKKVTGIEQSDLAAVARKACETNGLSEVVEFIQSDLFSVELKNKADVIVHDQIGDFVWNEGAVSKLAFAKKNFLKPGGVILPFKIDVYFVPVSHISSLIDLQVWDETIEDLKFSDFKKAELEQIEQHLSPRRVVIKNDSCFLAEPQLCTSVYLGNDSEKEVLVSKEFEVKNDGICTAVLGFMKIHFTEKISLSTAPSATVTNWGQFSLLNTRQKLLRCGDKINFSLKASEDYKAWQWKIS